MLAMLIDSFLQEMMRGVSPFSEVLLGSASIDSRNSTACAQSAVVARNSAECKSLLVWVPGSPADRVHSVQLGEMAGAAREHVQTVLSPHTSPAQA